ncbi:alpha/beta hydrolase family protein [Candidatus Lokiarchaeum ossiferum]|uniref:alpha/beta hydrolase family protein n=1 Tax=Candidatus Lokiarchaeum ossiferum TaxID=2951803 RepID=UPI00352C1745
MALISFLGGMLSGILIEKLQKSVFHGVRIRRIEKNKQHWVQSQQITRKQEKILMDDGRELQGYIYSSDVTPETAPSIIFFHGLGGFAQDYNFEVFLSSLCLAGYRVFAYDFRASGNSRIAGEPHILKTLSESFVHRVYQDVHFAFEWVYNHIGVDQQHIFAIGASFGGSMVLSQLLHEERVGKIIALCAPHDSRVMFEQHFKQGSFFKRMLYKSVVRHIPDEEAFLTAFHEESPVCQIKEEVSYENRIFLAHSKNDNVVLFKENFEHNKFQMRLPDVNCMVFDQGGHEFAGNQAPLMARILFWLQN